jgi:hypothetical protein
MVFGFMGVGPREAGRRGGTCVSLLCVWGNFWGCSPVDVNGVTYGCETRLRARGLGGDIRSSF